MTEIERDCLAYNLAKEYLLSFESDGITPWLLEKYLEVPEELRKPDSKTKIYRQILASAQAAAMKPRVIGEAIGGFENLGILLDGFDPQMVLEKFKASDEVLDAIELTLKPHGKLRRTARSIWPQYCKTILSAARFVVQFSTAKDFYNWVDLFDNDNIARAALPLLLHLEIEGFGFALACDFLKELGYVNFAKPDVQIRELFEGLALCPPKADDYHLFKSVIRVARNVGVTPYNADKVFWLVGSGYFYNDKQIGNKGRIKTSRNQYIAETKIKLAKLDGISD